MKFLLLVLATVAVAAVRAEIEVDEGVLVLTDENFEEAINGNEHLLVEFCEFWRNCLILFHWCFECFCVGGFAVSVDVVVVVAVGSDFSGHKVRLFWSVNGFKNENKPFYSFNFIDASHTYLLVFVLFSVRLLIRSTCLFIFQYGDSPDSASSTQFICTMYSQNLAYVDICCVLSFVVIDDPKCVHLITRNTAHVGIIMARVSQYTLPRDTLHTLHSPYVKYENELPD